MTDQPKPKVILDDRETEVNSELSLSNKVDYTVVRIDNGVDGIWDKNWAWQRKRGDDWVSSIQDGRMHDIKEQQQLYPNLVLIIEDKERAFLEGRLPEAAVMGSIASALIHKHVNTVYTRDFHQTALFIERMAFQLQAEEKNYPIVREKRKMTLEERQLFLLQGFYKCGPEISMRLLARYGTPWAVINAIGQNDVDVDKVGPKLKQEWRRDLGI